MTHARPERVTAEGTARVVFDRYRLDALLGTGATAEVWRAYDQRVGRTVAVKLLHGFLLQDRKARIRLLLEAHAAASLDHPSIVRILDVLMEDEELAAARVHHPWTGRNRPSG